MIPKVIFQTSKYIQPEYVIKMITDKMPSDWSYIHFTDSEILDFFKNNYLEEFPNIINKFNNMPTGAHKADLFRYYYLYICGGVFIDSDLMITTNIVNITSNYDLITVQGGSNHIFQGLIASTAKNKIIYDSLVDAYNIDLIKLTNYYHLLCANMHTIIHNYDQQQQNYKLYKDREIDNLSYGIYDNDKLIAIHYHANKIIPPDLFNK
jgi:mannosyltransferase OCH1-like enzyme